MSDLIPFTPAHRAADSPPAVFFLKAPTVYERGEFMKDTQEAGLVLHSPTRLRAELKLCLKEIIDDPALIPIIEEAIQSWTEGERTPAVMPPDNLIEAVLEVEREALRIGREEMAAPRKLGATVAHPRCVLYARLVEERNSYIVHLNGRLVRGFLKGWENFGPFEKDAAGRPTEETLQRLGIRDVSSIAERILMLMGPTEDERKNSESPPQ